MADITLDPITLPPAPNLSASHDLVEHQKSVERWTRQCEQTIRQLERTIRDLIAAQGS